jgi:SRSO17 transposase
MASAMIDRAELPVQRNRTLKGRSIIRCSPSCATAFWLKAWIIDDTSYPKQGTHSVGVHHQYCGQLGKQANCQVAVTLSIANHHASLPLAYRLYLPKDWADDAERRDKAHVPEAIRFKTKPQIALAQLGAALAAGVARGVVLMDASYGTNSALRAGIGAQALTYVAAILPTVKVRAVADPDRRVSAKQLALSLPNHAWRTITWRDGSAAPLRSRFARVQVRTAPSTGAAARPQETLLIEWPDGETASTKYWLSNITATTSFRRLVDIAKLRWRIERDYQELKQEIGLGHYEGRGWRGFHHHGTLCIAAYGFLISARETIPPSGPRSTRRFAKPPISSGYRPRGAAANGTSPTQSRPSIAQWWSQSQGCCRAVHAAPADFHETCDEIYDAVVPGPPQSGVASPNSRTTAARSSGVRGSVPR